MADLSGTDDVKPPKSYQHYWLTLEEAQKQVKALEEKTGTRYTSDKDDPSFGTSGEYPHGSPWVPYSCPSWHIVIMK